jgi:thiol:disulfide interchange protein DsbD
MAIVLMGVGMALPYAALILVPGLLTRLPKPGPWMDVFKKSCGFLLLLVAVKLCLPALPKDRLISVLLYGVIFGFCAWMWGAWVSFSTAPVRRWSIRTIAVLLAALTGGWLLPAPPEPRIAWQNYDPGLVEQTKAQARPVLLDFTADWCTNCKVLDRTVYADSLVAEQIAKKGVLPVKADTTSFDSPATQDFTKVYGEAGNVPVTILILPGRPNVVIRGLFNKERLLDILSGLPDAERR